MIEDLTVVMQPQNVSGNDNLNFFKNLPKPQRYAVVVLFFLALGIIIFWVWQMNSKIRAPYIIKQPQESGLPADVSDVDSLLRDRDTDQDGLSDYDEIYTYQTSPYLEDTDSDGLGDEQEVRGGSDPNCPQGQICGAQELEIITPLDEVQGEEVDPLGSQSGSDLERILSGDVDGAILRQLLISTGSATAQDLESISDEDLLHSYQEALKNQANEN